MPAFDGCTVEIMAQRAPRARGFEKALERFESLSYLSLAAVLGDGWNVD